MNSVQAMVTVRRERLKQELREEVLDAARKLFVTEGYTSVSMRKIAERVGCAPGTIYLHFKDKDSILDAICEETFSKLSKRMSAITDDDGDPLERLRRGGRTYIQFALDHPYHYLLTFGTLRPERTKPQATAEAGYQCFDNLRSCVRKCVEAGVTSKTDIEELSQALWTNMHGVVMLLITECDFPFIEQSRLIDSVLDLSIEGIRKK